MSTSHSQKYAGYSIVPWYNSAEWKNVYTLIFAKNSSKHNLQSGLDIITQWQMRTPHLPSGVEGTLCILEALLIDNEDLSERQYQILCASSVMRFLNICVACRAQVYSFTQTAKDNCIPDWIIGIRHDFAHSQRLPSISLLKLALKESFRWLENTYWQPELAVINDNIISGINEGPISLTMGELIGLYCNLFVYDVKGLCYDEFIQDKLELVEPTSKIDEYHKAILTLLEQGVVKLSSYEWNKCLEEMIHSYWYIINTELLIDKKGNCTNHYLIMGNLMNLLEKHNKITGLIIELIYIVVDQTELSDNRIGAAQWINEIFKGMLKFRKKQGLADVPGFGIHFKQIHKNTIDGIKQLKHRITVDVLEHYRKYFINSYLLLLDVSDVTSAIKELNKKTIAYSDDASENSLKIQDEESEYEKLMEHQLQSIISLDEGGGTLDDSMDVQECDLSPLALSYECNESNRWTLVTDTSIFESCAIGVIPTEWN